MNFMIAFSNFVNKDIRIFRDIELNLYISFVHFHNINSFNQLPLGSITVELLVLGNNTII